MNDYENEKICIVKGLTNWTYNPELAKLLPKIVVFL